MDQEKQTLVLRKTSWEILSKEISAIIDNTTNIFKPYAKCIIPSISTSNNNYLIVTRLTTTAGKVILSGNIVCGPKHTPVELVSVAIGDIEGPVKALATVDKSLYFLGVDYKEEQIQFPLYLEV
jgi:hypothetical protein